MSKNYTSDGRFHPMVFCVAGGFVWFGLVVVLTNTLSSVSLVEATSVILPIWKLFLSGSSLSLSSAISKLGPGASCCKVRKGLGLLRLMGLSVKFALPYFIIVISMNLVFFFLSHIIYLLRFKKYLFLLM